MQVKIRVRWHELQWTIGTPSAIVSGPHASLASNDENVDVLTAAAIAAASAASAFPMQRPLLTYYRICWRGSCQNGVEEIIINLFCLYTNLELWLLDSSLAKKFFSFSFFFFLALPGLRFFLLILWLRKDADSLKPLPIPALQVIYHIRRAALRRSLLTNITKFWREAQPLK